jgi:hypothetical protein
LTAANRSLDNDEFPSDHRLAGVEFSRDIRDQVKSGAITVSYRLWSRPKVKLGGRYAFEDVFIEIDAIELAPFSSIEKEDVSLAGEENLESLRQRAAHAGPIDDDTLLYRVEFHIVRS